MALLQTAYETYGFLAKNPESSDEGHSRLLPISHIFLKTQIEITINAEGDFISACAVDKSDQRTVIPATEESANRVGDNDKAHPLCDQLRYLAPEGGKKYTAYISQLRSWAESDFSHPKIRAVLRYTEKGKIASDLIEAGLIESFAKAEKDAVRWRILNDGDENSSACWEDESLFECFTEYYKSVSGDRRENICCITGELSGITENHPKGTLGASYGAKLISANDSGGFTYRGRFVNSSQAVTVSYEASQKAHSALQWLIANEGVYFGGRTFVCWNPKGKPVPKFGAMDFDFGGEDEFTFESYRDDLKKAISGYKLLFDDSDSIVFAAFEAATTGRLSVTYYSEQKASDFLQNLKNWNESCCWYSRLAKGAIKRPPVRQIVNCAFGTQRENFITADDKVIAEQMQRLLHCIVDGRPVPADIVSALAKRVSAPLAYSGANREILLTTACAVIRKYHNDKAKTEEWTMALDKECKDRSYLYGRLLAVYEKIEQSTFGMDEKRETNAIKLQAVFCSRPLYGLGLLEKAAIPYFKKLEPGLCAYYKNIIGEILDKLDEYSPEEKKKKLGDTYVLGYYLQRADFYKSKKNDETKESEEN